MVQIQIDFVHVFIMGMR